MRGILFLGLSVLLCACALPKPVSKANGLASFNKTELAAIDEAACTNELERTRHGERWWLCGYGWRPANEPGGEKAVESYRLFWVRAAEPRVVLRIARYEDGSGVLWAMAEDKSEKAAAPRMLVTTLKEEELKPLFARLQGSPLWASTYARPGTAADDGPCKSLARWILEGQRTDDHRAVSVQSCGEGRWAVDLGAEMLKFARTKVPGLPAEQIY